MRNLKKFLALVLAFMMAMSLMLTANAASKPADFSDKGSINTNYAEAVNVLSALGVLKGQAGNGQDGQFMPKGTITRAEIAAIIYRVVTGDVGDDNVHLYGGYKSFTDLNDGAWYIPYVNYCENNGLVNGVGGGRFAPGSPVTGYEALVMILRAIGYNNPAEFSSSDWKLKSSGYGRRLGITTNIPEGSLGGSATREMVAEIIFKGIQAPTVTYNMLLGYTNNLLVDASSVNPSDGSNPIYAADVPSSLLYETFGIVGKRTILGADNYGRPAVEWVKDDDTDTVLNGGKYIVNVQDATGAIARPVALSGATYAAVEDSELVIPMTPIKTYYDVVDECTLATDINNNNTIAASKVTEWLNGRIVADRTNALDALHTREATIGAPGRTTEIYKLSNGDFVFVYVDTMMGTVTNVIPRTRDTAGHVMSPASLYIKVNEGVTVVSTSRTTDYAEWKVGDLILLNTYGGQSWDTRNKGADGALSVPVGVENLQMTVPHLPGDFLWYDMGLEADGSVGSGVQAGDWGVDILSVKPTTVTFTANATVGAVDAKTGLVSTDQKTYLGNVVYLANENTSYYSQGDNRNALAADATTVPATATDYGVPMINEDIGKSFTAVLDKNGYVVGLTAATVSTNVGVVTELDSVRVGTGKYAIEATMLMMDGTKQTVRFVDHEDYTAGTPATGYKFFTTQAAADASINVDTPPTGGAERNLLANVNVLIKIEPFTLEGATYYKVIETNDGAWTAYSGADNPVDRDPSNNVGLIATGVANALTQAANDTGYNANPGTDENIDNNTKFIIGEADYRYNEGTGNNQGGFLSMTRSVYTGFKTIPTIAGDNTHIEMQRIDNNVYICPDMTQGSSLDYNVRTQTTVPVDETYLVLGTVATYADHSTYKVLKDGEETTLDVSNVNQNAGNPNVLFEDTLIGGSNVGELIVVTAKNTRGYVTAAELITTNGTTRTLPVAAGLFFDKTGVIAIDNDGNWSYGQNSLAAGSVDGFLTVAEDCTVQIVNLLNGSVHSATLDNVKQYENFDANNNGTYDAGDSHSFVYELDQYGYVSHIYILD